MKSTQYGNDETLEMTKRIRTSLSIKKDETLTKERRNRPCHKSKKTRIKIIISNTYEIRETIIHKRLSR